MIVLFDLYDMLVRHCHHFQCSWGLRQHHSFLLRTLRLSIWVMLFTRNHFSRPPILMKFIVLVWTTMKISSMTSASYHSSCFKSFQCPEPQRQFPPWPCISLCIYKAPARTVPPHTNRQLFQVRSLCKFAVMTSKALVALLAVVVACISESSSQDTLYQATGSCQVGLG